MSLTIATIVCAYNESRLLPGCLHSLLAQTRPPDDILVINNASTDETGEWMEPSRAPSLNGDGRVLVFASRHPIDHEAVRHDDDLFVWMRGGN